jgi:hypothetical protein
LRSEVFISFVRDAGKISSLVPSFGVIFLGKEGRVGSGGKEIDVWYDDILIPEPMTHAHVYYTFALHIYT